MPQLNFVQEGAGPLIVFSHALGCDLSMWDSVAALLRERHTVLRYDARGHGKSERVPGPYSMDALADDAAELIGRHGKGPVNFVGLSMGGMTAQSLAARHPALVQRIVIANSAACYDEAARAGWDVRIATVHSQGMSGVSEGAMQRWFTPGFRADERGAACVAVQRAQLESCDPASYAASCVAVRNIDFRQSNPRIACPALVIAGKWDEATPPALSESIAQSIPGARLRTIDASHLSAIERPAEFAALVAEFIETS
ncbi:MAG: alpha/beta fold hydrolase [Burkholderiaceae bacterium]|nr:alpha/beta fold hydrolase [Burkholderiaceae bacterium]